MRISLQSSCCLGSLAHPEVGPDIQGAGTCKGIKCVSAHREGGPEEGGDDGGAGCGHGRLGALPPQRRHGLRWHVPDVAIHALAVRHILQHHLRVPCTERLIVLVVSECLVGVCPASVVLECLVGVCPVSVGS